MSEALDALCREAGLVWHYHDGAGREQQAPPESRRAVLAAMGLAAETDEDAASRLARLQADHAARLFAPWQVVTAGQHIRIEAARGEGFDWRLVLEDGSEAEGRADACFEHPGLPAGRHVLTAGEYRTTLLSAPERLPQCQRAWGVTLPLYGLEPERGGGIGTYGDLARAASALGALGSSFAGVNPVHAGFPTDPANFSPYAPSSRRMLNTMLIEVAGEPPSATGPVIGYEAAFASKRKALEAAYAAFDDDPEFEAYRMRGGEALTRFSVHQALSDEFGPYWFDWPEEYRSPASDAVAAFAACHPDRLRFHQWLQWTAECQLADAQDAARAAGMRYGLYLDLAVGTHPAGAETWTDGSLFAAGVSLGAPPDAFSAEGQVWGVAPLSPRALQEDSFAVLAETLREQLRFSGILRIDHILGFERTFWCPEGLPGLYVTMPKAAMLAVLRMEAARAGAVVIGEDLGNIPDGLRHDLEVSGILGCRVAMFERHWHEGGAFKRGDAYDHQVLASFSSHDLPTWAGWRKATDIDWRNRIGDMSDEAATEERRRREHEVGGFDAVTGDRSGSVDAMHEFLSGVASHIVALQAEDILGVEEQPNLPGTIFEHPNWRRRLPVQASAFSTDERFQRTAEIMRRSGR
jgi:4-alpha-glucanotransferase